jgi:hypothetical protein
MSASAGSAITASPSQLGATTSTRPGSDIGSPSPMHPEPEVRVPADVHLQHVVQRWVNSRTVSGEAEDGGSTACSKTTR